MKKNAKSTRLGCLSISSILGGILVVLAVGIGYFLTGGAIFSPGQLNSQTGILILGNVRSHAEIKDCAACHASPIGSARMADQCIACHTDLKEDPKNFHVVMIGQGKFSGCRTCHTEHNGPNGSLTKMDAAGFPHSSLGFSLQSHQKMADGTPFKCSDCHGNGYIQFDKGICNTCHLKLDSTFDNSHITTFGSACLECHDGVETYGHAFKHQNVPFSLTGKHTAITCNQCHVQEFTLAALKATKQDCFSCHAKDDVHQGDLGQDCARCHTPDDWKNAKIDHSLTSFPLVGKHQTVDCTACHLNNVFKGTPKNCFACHAKDDAHNGDLGTDCAMCHTPVDWKQATIDHSKTTFPLTGKHLTVDCASCHVNNAFKGIPTNCYGCHAKDDHHKGQFGQDCSACHTTAGWLPANFDHAKSGFPLTGAHAKLTCNQCHANGVFKGLSTACAGCHAEPAFHAGLLGINCASCHSTTAWTPAKFNGPHQFPMGHGGASSCRNCHPSTLAQYTCYSCHNQSEMANSHSGVSSADLPHCVKCHATGGGGN